MKDSASEPTLQPTDPDKQVPQYSIGKLFAWTGVVAGGFTVVTASVSVGGHDLGIFVAAFNLSIYLILVCGLWMLIQATANEATDNEETANQDTDNQKTDNQETGKQDSKSHDFWVPVGMSTAAPVIFLFCTVISPHRPGQIGNELVEQVSALTLFLGLPYAVGLLALTYRRTLRRGFSLRVLVFYFGCWLWWMMCSFFVYLGSSGALT